MNDYSLLLKGLLPMEIRKKFSIIIYVGGKTQIVTDETGHQQLEIWHIKGYVTQPVKAQNGAWVSYIVNHKFLSISFKNKR